MLPILEQIRNGRIISDSEDEQKQQKEQERIEVEIEDVVKAMNGVETQIKDFEEIQIPDIEHQIKQSKE
jgi:hypothetical protein